MQKKSAIITLVSILIFVVLACLGRWFWQRNIPLTTSVEQGTESGEQSGLAGTLVPLVPPNSYGFFQWDSTHPAYKTFSSSPWAGGGENWSSIMGGDKAFGQAAAVLKRIGIDYASRAVWEGIFSQAVAFLAPAADGKGQPVLGFIFRSAAQVNLAEKFGALRQELSKADYKVDDLTLPGITGLGVTELAKNKDAGAGPRTIFIGWNKQLGAIATDQDTLGLVLTAKGSLLPDICRSDSFQRLTRELAGDRVRYSLAYLNLEPLIGKPELSSGSAQAKVIDEHRPPLKALALASSMQDQPRTELQILFDDTDQRWAGVFGSSAAGSIVDVLVDSPMVFLSIDGATLSRIKEQALGKSGSKNSAQLEELALLDSVDRIGLALRAAAPGQSILPVPDIVLVAQTQKPDKVKEQVKDLIAQGLSSGQFGQMKWSAKQLGQAKVEEIMTPLNVGMLIAAAGDLVIVSSTETQLKSALGQLGDAKKFADILPVMIADLLRKEISTAKFSVDFREVAAFIETMGGLLSMYAPQNNEAKRFLEPEYIEGLKKMGMLVGTAKFSNGILRINSFYHPDTRSRN